WGTKLLGRASAVTVLLFIFLVAICFIYFAIISKWEKEGRK
ncbi:sugar ABC transporter permease, partial [Streptococcus pneumoniae]